MSPRHTTPSPASGRPSLSLGLGLCAVLALALGCGSSADDPPPPNPDARRAAVDAAAPADAAPADAAPIDATSVRTYADDIAPIWANRCIPCHFEPDPQPPDLAIGRAALIALGSSQVDLQLIEPGDPEASYLWLKLNNLHTALSTTDPMPQPNLGGAFEPIPASELARIEAWIASGADESWQ